LKSIYGPDSTVQSSASLEITRRGTITRIQLCGGANLLQGRFHVSLLFVKPRQRGMMYGVARLELRKL